MEKKYIISARKYRPQNFKDVIGQQNILKTLKNSIFLQKIAQAYLFSGPKGTGKTTITRIFAKALNCQNLKDGEPCNLCRSCMEISNSSSLDVIEIDGASNRGIEDIKKINETTRYTPIVGKYKIYIIDEVHMLTKEAFNALLKTLEEPPSTIKFFFATTEVNKVLPTIISRCQRFDLKPLKTNDIIKKLQKIANDQNKKIEDKAFEKIAKFALGSLRDAESMLDQVLCYNQETLSEKDVIEILGFIPQNYFFSLDAAVHEKNISFAFELLEKLYMNGKDLFLFLQELTEHFRKILILKFQNEKTDENYEQAKKIYSQEQCIYILDLLTSCHKNFTKSISKKIFLEVLIIKIIQSKDKISFSSLIKRLLELEKKIDLNKNQSDNLLSSENKKNICLKLNNVAKELEKDNLSSKEEIVKSKSFENIKKENLLEENKTNLNQTKEPLYKSDKETLNKASLDTLMQFTAVEFDGILKKE